MSTTTLRRSPILPLFNLYTVMGLLVISYLGITSYLRILWGSKSGVEYLYILMLVQLIPIVIAFTRRHFTYIGFIMVFHFVQLSLPKWLQFRDTASLTENFPEVVAAIQEQTFCTVLIILIYYAARRFLFSGMAEKERFQLLTLTRPQVYLLSAYVIFVPFFLHRLPAWFFSVHFLLLSADLTMLYTSQSPSNEVAIRFTKIAAVFVAMAYFLETGMMTLLGALTSLYALIVCLRKQFRSLALVVMCVVGISAVQTVKAAFRVVIHNPEVELTLVERMGVLWELIYAKYIDDEDTEIDDDGIDEDTKWDEVTSNLISGFLRAGDDSLERVLAATPSKVPFWEGESYASIPYMFVPRALWPDKPSRHFWNKFGRLYGVLSSQDFQTSVGVSYLAEAYMNFGYNGMYLCAVLVGFLFALVERSAYFILHGYFYFPYIVLLTPLLAPATDLGSMLNSLWVIYLVFLFGRPLLTPMAQRDEYS